MKNGFLIIGALLLVTVFWGCQGLNMDYGKPAAQFLEEDVAELGKNYLRKKITIKGVVTRVEVSPPKDVSIFLGHGIECDLGDVVNAAKHFSIGKTVYMDGILRKCEPGTILLEPVLERDPKAPFNPKK
ncbi:MAG: hypothetical protein H8E43_06900 [Planctomycetia bacterium]|nr:hypothetical protein [Planctomycetia bacterium]MBL6915728.1 hypothetical protein [Planctomycetota bacterium]